MKDGVCVMYLQYVMWPLNGSPLKSNSISKKRPCNKNIVRLMNNLSI